MKDPLFIDDAEHPYELLGVGARATIEEINLAFKRGFAGPNRVQLRNAQSILLDPGQRLLVDLFDFDDSAFGQLIAAEPSPSRLVGPQRPATSKLLWAVQKDAFPDLRATHGLAVLFYWWANAEEESFLQLAASSQGRPGLDRITSKVELAQFLGKAGGAETAGSGKNSTDDLWKWAIAHWALLLESPTFWEQWIGDRRSVYGGVNGTFTDSARAALSAKIESRMRRLAERNRTLGTTGRADRLQRLELALTNERSVGRRLAKLNAGISTTAGPVACGRVMLELLGAVATVREQLARRLAREKENIDLQALWLQLSEHAYILTLIDRKDWQGAQNALGKLPESERNSAEASELRARALSDEGAYYALQDDTASAFNRWKHALEQTRFDGLKKSILEAIVTHTKKRVASLQEKTDLTAAFKVVEDARAIVGGTSLDKTLSHLYMLRAEQHYADAGKAAQNRRPLAEIEKELRACIADLKKATEYDKQNEAAAQRLRDRESELKSLIEAAGPATRLGPKATLKDLTAEIDKLHAKLRPTPSERQMLAALLQARAIKRLEGASSAMETAKRGAGAEIRRLFRWAWLPRIPFYLFLPIFLYFDSKVTDFGQLLLKAAEVWFPVFVVAWVIVAYIPATFRWTWPPRMSIPFLLFMPVLLYFNSQVTGFNAVLLKTAEFWLPLLAVCSAVRSGLRSMKPGPFPGSVTFCGICAKWANGHYSLPGYGNASLCGKHHEQADSILKTHMDGARFGIAFTAAQDVQRALELWPEVPNGTETLVAIRQMEPLAVDSLLWGKRKQANPFDNPLLGSWQ